MERQIKFRGKCAITGVWRYGFYYISKGNHIIRDDQDKESIVLSATTGQFTGLHDKNGVDIYEGDQFAPDTDNDEVKSVVRWDYESAKFVVDSYGYDFHIGEGSQEVYDNELSICDTVDLGDMIIQYCEVIGNIHDRKEVKP